MVKDAFSLLMYLQAMDLCLMIGCIQANVASSLHFLPTIRSGLVWAGLGGWHSVQRALGELVWQLADKVLGEFVWKRSFGRERGRANY